MTEEQDRAIDHQMDLAKERKEEAAIAREEVKTSRSSLTMENIRAQSRMIPYS